MSLHGGNARTPAAPRQFPRSKARALPVRCFRDVARIPCADHACRTFRNHISPYSLSSASPVVERASGRPGFLYRVDRNLGLCLPRLSVLLSIEANRPRAWSSGPLGPYQAWFTGIQLISKFERVKAPGNPTKSRVGLLLFWGSKSNINHLRA